MGNSPYDLRGRRPLSGLEKRAPEAKRTPYDLSRRRALAGVIGLGCMVAIPDTGHAKPPRDLDKLSDRQFRAAFMRALARQRRAKEITKAQYLRYKRAAWSGLPFASSQVEGGPKSLGTFITHLKNGIAKDHPEITQGFLTIFATLASWIVENWPEIMRVLLTLLAFLDTAEEE